MMEAEPEDITERFHRGEVLRCILGSIPDERWRELISSGESPEDKLEALLLEAQLESPQQEYEEESQQDYLLAAEDEYEASHD